MQKKTEKFFRSEENKFYRIGYWCQFHQHFTCNISANRSQKRKKICWFNWIFMFLGSAEVKALHKMLMKLTSEIWKYWFGCKKQDFWEANPIKIFFSLLAKNYSVFCCKLGHLIINDFYIYNQHSHLTVKISQKKGKKGFIGSATEVCG